MIVSCNGICCRKDLFDTAKPSRINRVTPETPYCSKCGVVFRNYHGARCPCCSATLRIWPLKRIRSQVLCRM